MWTIQQQRTVLIICGFIRIAAIQIKCLISVSNRSLQCQLIREFHRIVRSCILSADGISSHQKPTFDFQPILQLLLYFTVNFTYI
jgi:hypothetical protein